MQHLVRHVGLVAPLDGVAARRQRARRVEGRGDGRVQAQHEQRGLDGVEGRAVHGVGEQVLARLGPLVAAQRGQQADGGRGAGGHRLGQEGGEAARQRVLADGETPAVAAHLHHVELPEQGQRLVAESGTRRGIAQGKENQTHKIRMAIFTAIKVKKPKYESVVSVARR